MNWDYGITDEMIATMTQMIVRAIDPVQIVLFGSWGRGSPRPDSDIDLMLVLDPPNQEPNAVLNKIAICNQVKNLLDSFAVPIDLVVFTPNEVRYWEDDLNSIVTIARSEGKVLYDRPEKRAKAS